MYRKIIKRIIDFLLALIFTPFVLLLIIIIAPFIYFNDKGPIFYYSVRHGKDGKPFKMLKFRSMYVNSPDIKNADGSTYNGKNDIRVTKVGRILRETSLDEVPQILNVLIGNMSFIGPRPSLVACSFKDLSPLRQKVLLVRPGITGYTQAYYRNSISMEEKFECDANYVDHISFLFDVKIVFKTISTVINRKNIYVEEKKTKM